MMIATAMIASCATTPEDPTVAQNPDGEPSETAPTSHGPNPNEGLLAADAADAPARAITRSQAMGLLQDANEDLHRLGLRRKPRLKARGIVPPGLGLKRAYGEGRAMNFAGTREEARRWMAWAKFGPTDPGTVPTQGPLAQFDLILSWRDAERAWLHVMVPRLGFASVGRPGSHHAWHKRERWILLSDVATPGSDYVVFKRDGTASLDHQWGRASVIADLVALAAAYLDQVGVPLGIGDISRSTGGTLPDHWTHKKGLDADLYLLDYPQRDKNGSLANPHIVWHTWRSGRSVWSTQPDGQGHVEPPLAANGDTRTAARLRFLAQAVLPRDDVAYFVHNDPEVLDRYDADAQQRRPGRRYLHAQNRAYWPAHQDHVHLRWAYGRLPVGKPPRP